MTARPARSWLFTPATKPDRFGRAAEAGADVLIVDLEDAVAPVDKERARAAAIAHLLATAGNRAVPCALRINPVPSLFGFADIAALLRETARPDYLILPKCESAEILKLLESWLRSTGIECRLVAMIETAQAVGRVETIASACSGLAALFFGAADLAADLDAEIGWETLLSARSRIVNAAAAAGIEAIDSPFFRIDDDAGLAEEALRARHLGFTGKSAVHPRQIGAINAAMTPGAAAVAHARRVLAENEKGVGVVGGQMVDEAVARRARRILTLVGG